MPRRDRTRLTLDETLIERRMFLTVAGSKRSQGDILFTLFGAQHAEWIWSTCRIVANLPGEKTDDHAREGTKLQSMPYHGIGAVIISIVCLLHVSR
jgi:hypothetical protein